MRKFSAAAIAIALFIAIIYLIFKLANPTPISRFKDIPSSVIQKTIAAASNEFGVNKSNITIVNAVKVTWPDSCLALHRVNERCVETNTPGFGIILRAKNNTYEYHTDITASDIRGFQKKS